MNILKKIWIVLGCTAGGIFTVSSGNYAQASPEYSHLQIDGRVTEATYLSIAESALRSQVESSTLSSDFWPWLSANPTIRAGLLLSADPVPVQFALNLDALRQAVSPSLAEKYAGLLLGFAIRSSPVKSESSSATARVLPEVQKTADYLTKQSLTLVEALQNPKAVLNDLSLDSSGSDREGEGPFSSVLPRPKAILNFWQQVAIAGQTYPVRGSNLGLLPFAQQLIAHQEATVAPFVSLSAEYRTWPLFPLAEAPYPLLALLQEGTVPQREMDFIWGQFQTSTATRQAELGYGNYNWNYEKISIAFEKSIWNPTSIPRFVQDGGVCGRLSTKGEVVRRMLGVPSVGIGQPGHRAFMDYGYVDGFASVNLNQSIAGPEQTTTHWVLPVPAVGLTPMTLHYALASALNYSVIHKERGDGALENYHQSMASYYAARHESDAVKKLNLLDVALQINPYNAFAWIDLAKATPVGNRKMLYKKMVNILLNGMSTPFMLLTNPGLPGNTDFTNLPNQGATKTVKGLPNYGPYLAKEIPMQINAAIGSK